MFALALALLALIYGHNLGQLEQNLGRDSFSQANAAGAAPFRNTLAYSAHSKVTKDVL